MTDRSTEAAERRRRVREQRVAAGLDQLDQWLRDQIRQGVAGAERAGYRQWDEVAARLIDAQAPTVAGMVRRLAGVAASGEGWTDRLLSDYALLRLLVVAYRRQPELAEPLRQTVRSRVGFTARQDEVRTGPSVRDRWHVLCRRDFEQDRLSMRRVWLRGLDTKSMALVLSFAPPGQRLDASLVVGAEVDAALAFYPGALPLRAVVTAKDGARRAGEPAGDAVADLLTGYARALALDPWLDVWPAVLTGMRPARAEFGWAVVDRVGDALELHPSAGDPWRLLGVSGGRPVTVAGEWTPRGLVPLTAWGPDGRIVML